MNEKVDDSINVYGIFMMLMRIIISEKMLNISNQWKKLVHTDELLETIFE